MNDFFVVPVSDESKAAARRDAAHALALEVAAFLGYLQRENDRAAVSTMPAMMLAHASGLRRALAKFRGEGSGS